MIFTLARVVSGNDFLDILFLMLPKKIFDESVVYTNYVLSAC